MGTDHRKLDRKYSRKESAIWYTLNRILMHQEDVTADAESVFDSQLKFPLEPEGRRYLKSIVVVRNVPRIATLTG
jgi:hypothetical protein